MIRSVDNPKTKSPIKWEDIDTSANAVELHIFQIYILQKFVICLNDKEIRSLLTKFFFRWHWTLRSVFGSSVFVITVIKTDWKSLWTQKRHLVIFTFNQCKMMMTGANLHHVKWIPVPISNWKLHHLQITIETDTKYRIDIVTFIFEQRKMTIPNEKLNCLK